MKRIDVVRRYFIEELGRTEAQWQDIRQRMQRHFPNQYAEDQKEIPEGSEEAELKKVRDTFAWCDANVSKALNEVFTNLVKSQRAN